MKPPEHDPQYTNALKEAMESKTTPYIPLKIMKKDLIPIRYKLIITRDELWDYLNLVKMKAKCYDFVGLDKLTKEIIEKYKEN